VRKFSRHFNGKVLTYGIRNVAAFRASHLVFQGLEGTQFQLEHKGASFSFQCPLIGEHNVANCLPALVVSHHFGLSFSVLEQRLKELKAHPGRGEVVKFRRGFTVVNDTYNSNPAALEIMVRFLKKVQGAKRRILVAGEMLELGSQSPDFHYNCGKTAAQAGLDFIVGVQGQAQHLVNAARLCGYDEKHALFFNEVPEAADWLQKEVREGDLVVVKGSRGVRTERVLEVLKWRED
jgi:UDP-N-acetylmuramoyl-tripeptide--D-alanyl-D-alanine ligase